MVSTRKNIFVLFITIILLLSSCSKQEYKNDIPCEDLLFSTDIIQNSELEYTNYDDDYLSFFVNDIPECEDRIIIYSLEVNNINEIGIFHPSNSNDVEKMKSVLNNYISDMRQNQKAFIASYAAKELSKLEEAEVRSIGEYVIYVIASQEERSILFSEIENKLKQK